jgi:imidazolonepropionase-like amidohydrolase
MPEFSIYAERLFDGIERHIATIVIDSNSGNINRVEPGRIGSPKLSGIVTPAFIDAHSHIGMERSGEPPVEAEVDDETEAIAPLCNPLNGIYFDDTCFSDAVDFGVLYSCVVPGSGNIIGGKAVIIKNYAANRKEAPIAHYGYKMALGYNPRSVPEYKGTRPNTRMGIYQMLEEAFDEALNKIEKSKIALNKNILELEIELQNETDREEGSRIGVLAKLEEQIKLARKEYALEFTGQDRAIIDLLDRRKVAKVHVHKEDDVYYLIELVNKYGIKATAEHCCDVSNADVFNALAEASIPIVYGPMGSANCKVELRHSSYKNAKYLMDSKAEYGIMSDHPVTMACSIRDCLRDFLIQGMSEADAIGLITRENAKILGMDDYGTIEAGKKASLIVWNKNPLHMGAFPIAVYADGKLIG